MERREFAKPWAAGTQLVGDVLIGRQLRGDDGVELRVAGRDLIDLRAALEIDVHELCHAVASLQSVPDPCHVGNNGVLQTAAPRTLIRPR